MTREEEAMLLSVITGANVEPDPYDLGYWSRMAGLPRLTSGSPRQEGWDDADEELAIEEALASQESER